MGCWHAERRPGPSRGLTSQPNVDSSLQTPDQGKSTRVGVRPASPQQQTQGLVVRIDASGPVAFDGSTVESHHSWSIPSWGSGPIPFHSVSIPFPSIPFHSIPFNPFQILLRISDAPPRRSTPADRCICEQWFHAHQ